MIAVLLIVRSEEGDGGENGLDLDKVVIRWLAVFDLKFFSICFEERVEFFGKHGILSCLLEWSWSPIWPIRVVVSVLSAFVDGLLAEVDN